MKRSIGTDFMHDQRVAEAKRLLLDALADHQQAIAGISQPNPDLQPSFFDLVREFSELRGGDLFYPYLGSGIGRGPLVELADGSIKYDFISGIGVHHFGHSNPRLVEAGIDAALQDTVMQGNLQQNVESVSLCRDLVQAANRKGGRLAHGFFSTSGAMANENALKIVFHKRYPADRILAFDGCFMGRSLALSQVTDKPAFREGLPSTLRVDYLPFYDFRRPAESVARALESLERFLARYPGKHAGMVFELVQGEGGFYEGSRPFFVALMEVLKRHGIPVIVDEVQTFGRTSELFAYQHVGLDEFPDLVTVGKALQVCATLFTAEFKPKAGLLSQTFTSSNAAIFAARVILDVLLSGGYFGPDGKISRLHEHFVGRLKAIEHRYPHLIEGPYGLGAMVAFTPFRGDLEKVKQYIHALFEAGVIAFYAGTEVSRVRFLLPVAAVSIEDIDEVSKIVEATLVKLA